MNAARNMLIYCLLNVRFKIIPLLKYKCFSFLFSPFLSSVFTLKNIPFSNKILKENLALKIFYFAFYFVMSFLNRKFVPIKRTFKRQYISIFQATYTHAITFVIHYISKHKLRIRRRYLAVSDEGEKLRVES